MSKSEAETQDDYNFWEFVSCARCYLPFSLEAGAPSIPFWLTECGHVLCNNHIKADQSCAKCGERDIQFSPLQTKMEQPMASWFTAIPQTLYATAYAATFQYNHLASLVRHYKRKCSQQRVIIEKLKSECDSHAGLQSAVEKLRNENQQLREYTGQSSDIPNPNGKRRMQRFHTYTNGAVTNSSPRMVVTPVGPERLTLPPSHQQPHFSGAQNHSDDGGQMEADMQSRAAGCISSADRRGSRRLSESYAYVSPRAATSRPTPSGSLALTQIHPVREAQRRRYHSGNEPHTSMSSASTDYQQPKKFKPSTLGVIARITDTSGYDTGAGHASDMPPPALPHAIVAPQQSTLSLVPKGPDPSSASSQHFVSIHGVDSGEVRANFSRTSTPLPVNELLSTQRFIPSTPSRNRQLLAHTPTSANVSRARMIPTDTHAGLNPRVPSRLADSQRMPFVPGSSRGFQ